MRRNRFPINPLLLFLLTGIAFGCVSQRDTRRSLQLVNLSHLNHLYEEISIDGRTMAIVHIYSEYPDYHWVEAKGEGIACVDDAARAAVVYLRHFEITGDTMSLRRGRMLMEFCRYMQAEDGLFYNFIFADHSINREGKTSYKSLGWWAGRALWAMGEGYRVFHKREPKYAHLLQQGIEKTFAHIDTLLAHFPKVDTVEGFLLPRWLLYNSAADATSELMLGLASYVQASQDPRAQEYLRKFSQGLMVMQLGDERSYPYGAFLSWKNIWHGWGNSQSQVLALAAGLTDNQRLLKAAEAEVGSFYPYWLSHGWVRQIEFARNPLEAGLHAVKLDTFPQIAYAIRPLVMGALHLARATGKTRYAELAGELATWFFGNNPAQARMYDPDTGRCYDGIRSRTEINRNSGAESTIEALYALLEVEANPVARHRLAEYLKSGK